MSWASCSSLADNALKTRAWKIFKANPAIHKPIFPLLSDDFPRIANSDLNELFKLIDFTGAGLLSWCSKADAGFEIAPFQLWFFFFLDWPNLHSYSQSETHCWACWAMFCHSLCRSFPHFAVNQGALSQAEFIDGLMRMTPAPASKRELLEVQHDLHRMWTLGISWHLLASLSLGLAAWLGHFNISTFLGFRSGHPIRHDPLLSMHKDHATTQEHAFSWARAPSGLHLCSLKLWTLTLRSICHCRKQEARSSLPALWKTCLCGCYQLLRR